MEVFERKGDSCQQILFRGNSCCLLDTASCVIPTLTNLFFPTLRNNYNYLHLITVEVKVQ